LSAFSCTKQKINFLTRDTKNSYGLLLYILSSTTSVTNINLCYYNYAFLFFKL